MFHPVVKNNNTNSFSYRVVPFDPSQSWLYERLTTTDQTLGRMPLYDTLEPHKIALVKKWIEAGAPDIFGNIPDQPNTEPTPFGLLAFLPDLNDYRVDTVRGRSFLNPFAVPANSTLDIWFGFLDDSTVPQLFSHNKVKFSKSPYDFSNAVTQDLIVESSPLLGPAFGGGANQRLPYYHHVEINTNQFSKGDVIYLRAYVNDNAHPAPTEIPENGSPVYFFTIFSFVVVQ
ncbi:MAG: hypothetical protein WD077_09550 [Bacteroidia bacterium]